MFPIIVVQSVKIFPPHLFTGAVGWITGVGVAGSAALPFVTGTLATRYGIRSLQPLWVIPYFQASLNRKIDFFLQYGCDDGCHGVYMDTGAEKKVNLA